jgi:hypothetical protein
VDQLVRNIYRNYPVRRLPDDLKAELDEAEFVTVTIENEYKVTSGTIILETEFDFRDGQVTRIGERLIVVQ